MSKRLSKRNYDFIKIALNRNDWNNILLNRTTIKCLFDNYNKSMYDFFALEDEVKESQQENKQLKERIDKAIEYLEEHYSDFPDGMKENYDEETIKILRGDSNE